MEKKEFDLFIKDFKYADVDKLESMIECIDLFTEEQKELFKPLLDERANIALSNAKNTISDAKLILKIRPIAEYLSIAYISRRFFGKSRSWLHNRLQGYNNNGKPDTLSVEDISKLQSALLTMSDEIKSAALRLS